MKRKTEQGFLARRALAGLLALTVFSGCNAGVSQAMSARVPEKADIASSEMIPSSAVEIPSQPVRVEDARRFTQVCEALASATTERAALENAGGEIAAFSVGLEGYLAELEKASASDIASLETLLGSYQGLETDGEEALADLTKALFQLEERLASILEDGKTALQAAENAGSRRTLALQIAALAGQEAEKAQQLYDGAAEELERAKKLLEQLCDTLPELQQRLEEAAAKEREESARGAAEQAAVLPQADSASSASIPIAPEDPPSSGAVKIIRADSASGYIRQEEAEEEMLRQINAYRKSLGLSPVTRDSALDNCAAIRCEEMLDNDLFSHTRPNGSNWDTVLAENGVKASAWGEIQYRIRGKNAISSQDDLADHAVDGWKNSKGHDAIMRSDAYDKIGVGAYQDGDCWIANIIFIR